jgi:tetratricopeptide (TPR) repeat protein
VKKAQLLLASGGLLLLLLLFFVGKTVAVKEKKTVPAGEHTHSEIFDIEHAIADAKAILPAYQTAYLSAIENSVSRGAVASQQIRAYNQLAAFWKDSVPNADLYIFYTATAANLVNSEKNLTFAARQIAALFRTEADLSKRTWRASQAIDLYEKAEMAGCYVFGKGMAGDAAETMKGIQQLLEVVKRDSANMQAQLLLGIGGVVSTQYDKAIERLLHVVQHQPGNLEAVSWLADAYAAKGDKANAVKWYQASKRLVNNPEFSQEVDERIKMLK